MALDPHNENTANQWYDAWMANRRNPGPTSWCSFHREDHPTGEFGRKHKLLDPSCMRAYLEQGIIRDPKSPEGLEAARARRNALSRARYRTKREGVTRRCQVCEKDLPITAFRRRGKSADYPDTCAACHKASQPERQASYRRGYAQRPEVKERNKVRQRRARKNNPEAFLVKSWRERASEMGAEYEETPLEALYGLYGTECYICGHEAETGGPRRPERLEWDHLMPLARGGAHSLANLRPVHGRCNQVKQWRTPPEVVSLLERQGKPVPPSLRAVAEKFA